MNRHTVSNLRTSIRAQYHGMSAKEPDHVPKMCGYTLPELADILNVYEYVQHLPQWGVLVTTAMEAHDAQERAQKLRAAQDGLAEAQRVLADAIRAADGGSHGNKTNNTTE